MNANGGTLSYDGRGSLPVLARGAPLTPVDLYDEPNARRFDLLKLWSTVRRNRLLILAIITVSLALGVLSVFASRPTYKATASIEINNQPVKVLGTEDYQQVSSPQETDRLLQTQIDILRSRAMAERVASDLSLTEGDEFLQAQGVKPRAPIKQDQVVDALRDSLGVTLPRNSRVVPVSFSSSDPKLAARVANRYAEDLITGNLKRHFDTASYSKSFLADQLELTKARLEQSERALLSYARSVGMVDPSAGGGDPNNPGNNAPRSLTSANLIDLNESLASAKASRMQAEGRWRAAQATPVMSLPEVLGNSAIQQMTQRRAELESQYEQELQRRKPDHPAVQQSAAALRELDRQISAMANSIRQSILNQYNVSRRQEAELSGAVGKLKGATLAEQQLGIRYNILKREVDTNRELYQGLLQRYKDVSAQAGVTSNNISIVDHADTPIIPVSPRPLVNISLAALIGLIISFVTVLLLEHFNNGVRSPEEIDEKFGLPVLGQTPRLAQGVTASLLLDDPTSDVAEAYQTVRTSIELSTDSGTPKTLLITSSRPGEGKSTTALAMARQTAMSGKKVLLIDADMRRPSLHRLMSVSREPGLSNFLTQQLSAEHVAHDTEVAGLSFMPAGSKPPNPAQLVSGDGMRALLRYLGDRYDQIIIDSPPVLGLADAPRLASLVDATIMVVEANRPGTGAVDNALGRLRAARANIIGAVLVKFDPAKADLPSSYAAEYYSYGDDNTPSVAGLIPATGAAG